MQPEQLDGRMIGYEGTVPAMLAMAAERMQNDLRQIRTFKLAPTRKSRKARAKIARRSRRRNRK